MFESLSQDPRSRVGQLARGANIYQGASKSPYAGKPTLNGMAQATLSNTHTASLLPQYKKMSLADVARNFLNANRTQ